MSDIHAKWDALIRAEQDCQTEMESFWEENVIPASDAHTAAKEAGRADEAEWTAYSIQQEAYDAMVGKWNAALRLIIATPAPAVEGVRQKLALYRKHDRQDCEDATELLEAIEADLARFSGNDADAAILEAWEKWQSAMKAAYASGRDAEPGFGEEVDPLEIVIEWTTAKTPQGAAIQIWMALHAWATDRWLYEAIGSGNFQTVFDRYSELDWEAKFMVRALQGLGTMPA